MERHQEQKIISCHAKWFCFLTILLLTISIVLVSAILVLKYVIRFRKPMFHLQSVHLDPNFRLDYTNFTMERNHTCSVASLVFSTQNPNKFGIMYSSSPLRVLYGNNSIGMIEVPSFYQPPKTANVTVFMHLLFKQLNLSNAVNEELMVIAGTQNNRFEIQINGAIRAQTHILNFPLPRIRVSY
jgi:Late embryogenesis abundant protein